jgi:hypothetical protein
VRLTLTYRPSRGVAAGSSRRPRLAGEVVSLVVRAVRSVTQTAEVSRVGHRAASVGPRVWDSSRAKNRYLGRRATWVVVVAERLRLVPRFAVICNPLFCEFAWDSRRVTKDFFWRG